MRKIINAGSFHGLGIAPGILEVLEKADIKIPTPVQAGSIPLGIEGSDVVGIAQTGTGKTHAFAIPMAQRLAVNKGVGLVIAPTRELAIQIDEVIQSIVRVFGMKTACLVGGASMQRQIEALRKKPRVVIATPGRLIDHIGQKNFNPAEVSILVLDEADRMFDMGFAPQIREVLKNVPDDRQTMLFSATMPAQIMNIAARHMRLPVAVEVAPQGTLVENVTQELYIVKKRSKVELLSKILDEYSGSVLLFSRTKYNAGKLARAVRGMGHTAVEIHSDRSLGQRRAALAGFKTGRFRVLSATDVAARGLDVTGIELVLNYDLPEDAESYVHRIGRTARAGEAGHAISFADPEQSCKVKDIEKLIRASLMIANYPGLSDKQFSGPEPKRGGAPGGGNARGKKPGASNPPGKRAVKKPGARAAGSGSVTGRKYSGKGKASGRFRKK